MATIEVPVNKTVYGNGTGVGGGQVVLYNDDHNSFDYVIQCLGVVFKHPAGLASKIAMEVHTRGRAVAEVEEPEKAREHAAQLVSMGLRAEAEGF